MRKIGKSFILRSPVLSILLAVFTVSPNKQYLGIFVPEKNQVPRHDLTWKTKEKYQLKWLGLPTTPAQTGPVWRPIRIRKCSVGLWGILNTEACRSRSMAIVEISKACRWPNIKHAFLFTFIKWNFFPLSIIFSICNNRNYSTVRFGKATGNLKLTDRLLIYFPFYVMHLKTCIPIPCTHPRLFPLCKHRIVQFSHQKVYLNTKNLAFKFYYSQKCII